MTRAAIISDIHGNLEALIAVLHDVDRQGIEEIHCLGDIIGYGPDPVGCVDLVRSRCRHVTRGNHDEALVKGPWGFNQLARDAIEWTRRQLRPGILRPGARARWTYLENLPLQVEWEGHVLVHGSPRDPTSEYVMPQQVYWPPPGMFEEIFEAFERVCFVGHTHIAGVFVEAGGDVAPCEAVDEGASEAEAAPEPGGESESPPPAAAPGGPRFLSPADVGGCFRAGSARCLVNVGSVGQPRDRDWRAAYVIVEGDTVRFCRVEYPVEQTQQKIRAIPVLDNRLADRLASGE